MSHQTAAKHLELPSSSRNDTPHVPTSGNELLYNTRNGTSTASSELQKSTEANDEHEPLPKPSEPTDPTSWPSDLLDFADQKHIDSDLAQYGSSDGVMRSLSSSDTSSSTSSDGSRKELPQPSTQEQIKGMGSHLIHPVQPLEGLWFRPQTDREARVVMDRMKYTSASNRAAEAFESHLQPDAAPELSVQRESICDDVGGVTWAVRKRTRRTSVVQHRPQVLDIEEQGYRRDGDRKTRATVLVLVVCFIFCLLSLALYACLRMG